MYIQIGRIPKLMKNSSKEKNSLMQWTAMRLKYCSVFIKMLSYLIDMMMVATQGNEEQDSGKSGRGRNERED